ncbi:hypothetical protein ACMFMG_008018 [Clarireedia jacksonii]
MVGVAKRSRGCLTCRRRRVRCDETRPVCERCTKSHMECEGYEKSFKFVDERSRAETRVRIKREAYLEAWRQEIEANLRHRSKKSPSFRSLKSSPSPSPSLSPPPSMSDVDSSEESEKTFSLLSRFDIQNPLLAWSGSDLSYNGPSEQKPTSAYCVEAINTMFYGRANKLQNCINHAMQEYCKALQRLRDDLQGANAIYSLTTMTNINSMIYFELMTSPSPVGFIGHTKGLQRICQILGPAHFKNESDLQIFDIARTSIVNAHIERKERCFLAEPEWLTLPWKTSMQPKSMKSQLYDRFCYIPGLLADLDILKSRVDYSLNEVDRLAQDVDVHIYKLYKWRSAWETLNPSCCSVLNVPPQDPPENAPPRSFTRLQFSNIQTVRELVHYNTALLLLYRIRIFLTSSSFVPTPSLSPLTIPFLLTNPHLLSPQVTKSVKDIAYEILSCLDYALSDEHVVPGSLHSIFPLRTISELFEPGSWEWNFIKAKCERMVEFGAFECAKGLMPQGMEGRLIIDEEGGLSDKAMHHHLKNVNRNTCLDQGVDAGGEVVDIAYEGNLGWAHSELGVLHDCMHPAT